MPLPKDPVIRGMLAVIRKGRVDATGPLADYLEEQGDPRHRAVREHYTFWAQTVRRWEADTSNRRVWPKWRAIASFHRRLRREIAKAFGLKWKVVLHRDIYDAMNP